MFDKYQLPKMTFILIKSSKESNENIAKMNIEQFMLSLDEDPTTKNVFSIDLKDNLGGFHTFLKLLKMANLRCIELLKAI